MRISSWSKAVVYPWWITTICAITTKRYVRNYWYIKSIRHEVLSCTLICIGFKLKTNCVCFKSKCCLDCFQISRPFQLVQLCLQVNLLRQMLITQQRLLSSEKRNCEALKWELNVAGVGIEEQKGNDKEFHVIWYATRMVLSIYLNFQILTPRILMLKISSRRSKLQLLQIWEKVQRHYYWVLEVETLTRSGKTKNILFSPWCKFSISQKLLIIYRIIFLSLKIDVYIFCLMMLLSIFLLLLALLLLPNRSIKGALAVHRCFYSN